MQQHPKVSEIKQEFFAYRNGIIADTLRNSGDCHKTIFGLNLPQIKAIANTYEQNNELAMALWSNSQSRECRMIAPYLFENTISRDFAQSLIDDVENYEIADILCFALLRNLEFANELVNSNITLASNMLQKYLAYRLALNLQIIGKLEHEDEIINLSKIELNTTDNSQLRNVLLNLIDTD